MQPRFRSKLEPKFGPYSFFWITNIHFVICTRRICNISLVKEDDHFKHKKNVQTVGFRPLAAKRWNTDMQEKMIWTNHSWGDFQWIWHVRLWRYIMNIPQKTQHNFYTFTKISKNHVFSWLFKGPAVVNFGVGNFFA